MTDGRSGCTACGGEHGLAEAGAPPVVLCWTCRDRWKSAGGETGLSVQEWLKENTARNTGADASPARCTVCGKLSDAMRVALGSPVCGTHYAVWISSAERARGNARDFDDFVRRLRAEWQNATPIDPKVKK